MPRVVVGDFGVITRLGLQGIFADLGFDVVVEATLPDRFIERVREVRPDVVVLDLDSRDDAKLAARVAESCAEVKVLACSTNEPRMWVFPRFHGGEFYESPITRDELVAAIRS